MSSWLFIGKGESNTSIARNVSGERLALAETASGVEVFQFQNGVWILSENLPGNFDSLDWSKWNQTQVVISPGVDPRRAFCENLFPREKRELDLFKEKFSGEMIGITGSLGKSTFTNSLGYIAKKLLGDSSVFVGGNIGQGCFRLFEMQSSPRMAILEVSSFMCERLQTAQFDWGVLLNVFQNHMDRYDSIEDYFLSKWNLIERSNRAIFPTDLPFRQAKSRVSDIEFDQSTPSSQVLRAFSEKIFLPGVSKDDLDEILKQPLPRLPHRQEFWKSPVTAQEFVNDSKSTTVQSTLAALHEFQARYPQISLILGGKDKGDDFSRLVSILRPDDRVFIYGSSREKISGMLKNSRSVLQVHEKFDDSVWAALQGLRQKELLLLSPGATSWDQFANFEERGARFWKLIGRP